MKFEAAKVKCPNCTEPGLELKWYKKVNGVNQYWDLITDSLHVCQKEHIKGLRDCMRCKEKYLRFKTINGKLYLINLKDEIHQCYGYKPNSNDKQIAHFYKNVVIYCDDDNDTKSVKEELQRSLQWIPIPEERKQMDLTLQLWKKQYEKHTFSSK